MADIWNPINLEPHPQKKVALSCGYGIFLVINYASNAGWLGKTNAQVSAHFPTPLTPKGWAFSIWGAIFVLQGLGVIVTVLRRFEDPDGARQRYANAVALPWILGWVLASGWQLLFAREHVEYMPLATLCILGSFASLMAGLLRLYRQHKQFGSPGNLLLYAAYFLPTSIMTSWLSVACGVQILILISSIMESSLDYISMLLLMLVTTLGIWLTWRHRDSAYALTLLWACLAIFEGTDSILVQRSSIFSIGLLLLAFIASVLQSRPVPEYDNGGNQRNLLAGSVGVV